MRSKKGVVELQFNWIFILIAGALIVTFFIVVVQKQKHVADIKLTSSIKADLSTILTGSRVSRGTSSLVAIPNIDINYDCEGYSVGDLQAINPGISFSPDLLKGNYLMMWSLDWNVPFRVDNFLYITSPEVRYIFVIDRERRGETFENNRFSDIYDSQEKPSFPPKTIIQDRDEKILFNKELVHYDEMRHEIKPSNNYKYRFIFLTRETGDPNFIRSQLSSDFVDIQSDMVTGLNIVPKDICGDNYFDCYGKIEFYKKNNANKRRVDEKLGPDTYYLGRQSVIAAVFAEKPEHYNCQMRRAFKRLKFVAQVYHDKVLALADYYRDTSCQFIESADGPLQNIIDSADYLEDNFPDSATLSEIEKIYTAMKTLEEINNQLQRLSCAEIY